MIGGSRQNRDYYDLPNVPYVVYFYRGYAIHGTYWHNNFGHPMSHGCVNLSIADAKLLYFWIDYATPIIIYGVTPPS
jgi:lipoprotein-anchoring transpeptidase ErfK/SrfK